MTKNEKNYLSIGACIVLILMSAANQVGGAWGEALKWVAILFATACFVVSMRAKQVDE